ncbi:MAG: response regulator [Bacteroidetes bacterium]|nr:response regulator [Bacteroidota bacterium]
MIKIVIADDHPMLVESMTNIINSSSIFTCLYGVFNGIDLLNKLKKNEIPDIVLLDVMMPELTGIDAIPLIKGLCPNTKIIMLTMFNENKFIEKCSDLGVDGYILKSEISSNNFTPILVDLANGKKIFPKNRDYLDF